MKQEVTPAISVLMPVYNGERYLSLAVESILGQSYPDFEFIIINDGSDDNSLSILESYADTDTRISLISRENKGLVHTLNEGIGLARGALIARMDADDIALLNRFQIQKLYMDSNPDVICVGGVCRVIDAKGRFLINTDTRTGHEMVEKLALQGVSPITHPSAMIRLDALKNVGGYAQEDWPAEDLALWIKLSAKGKIDNVPEIILEYRIHDNSISTREHDLQMKKTVEICAKACTERGVDYPLLAREGRPVESRISKYNITLRHGWWAFKSRQWRTAFVYGLKSIYLSPFKDGGWRLTACALFKRPRLSNNIH